MLYTVDIYRGKREEGRYKGRDAVFVRFAGCNLYCDDCPDKFGWMRKGKKVVSWAAHTLRDKIIELSSIYDYESGVVMSVDDIDYVVMVGGEPFIQKQDEFWQVVRDLDDMGYKVEIVTNGTVIPSIPFDVVFSRVLVTVCVRDEYVEYPFCWLEELRDELRKYNIEVVGMYRFDCKKIMDSIGMIKKMKGMFGDVYVVPREVRDKKRRKQEEECIRHVMDDLERGEI